MVQAKDPPAHYLSRLRTYLDPKASRSSRVSEFFIKKSYAYVYYIIINFIIKRRFMFYRSEKWSGMPLLPRFCGI